MLNQQMTSEIMFGITSFGDFENVCQRLKLFTINYVLFFYKLRDKNALLLRRK